ncbi:MAG: tRNA (guanosine(46)-N7)-methyltransferase TrmB [Methylococcaceae bacterium]
MFIGDIENILTDTVRGRRPIQSFVLRQGRLTPAQSQALAELEPRYGLPENQAIDVYGLFGRRAPLVVEIGFGNGDSLAEMAASSPDKDYIGIEVHRPGVGHLLMEIEKRELNNLRVHRGDAVKYLQHCLPDTSIYCLQIFFPDPWHKKKHHKRRLISTDFLTLAAKKLEPQGYIHIATDWEEYAEHCITVLKANPAWVNTAHSGDFVARPGHRPLTKFEQRGHRLGHGVWDIVYTRK